MRDEYVEPYEPAVLAERYRLTAEAVGKLDLLVARLGSLRTSTRPKVADALTGLELEQVRHARRVADLGTGMGWPGLALAAVLPQAEVTLVERNPMKCLFLERTSRAMRLANVAVVEATLPDWPDGCGACDLVTSRAAAPVATMLEWAAPLLVRGGSFVAWVGPQHRAEAAGAERAAAALGMQLAKVHTTAIIGERRRDLYVFERTAATSAAPPRLEQQQTRLAIATAADILAWQEKLDPAARERFQQLTRQHSSGGEAVTDGERDELVALCDILGVHELLRRLQRVSKRVRREAR